MRRLVVSIALCCVACGPTRGPRDPIVQAPPSDPAGPPPAQAAPDPGPTVCDAPCPEGGTRVGEYRCARPGDGEPGLDSVRTGRIQCPDVRELAQSARCPDGERFVAVTTCASAEACAPCPDGGHRSGVYVCKRSDGTVPEPGDADYRHTGAITCPRNWLIPGACPFGAAPRTECPPPGPACAAGPGQCCLDDGTVITPCGPIGDCPYSSYCGSEGFCSRCRCLAEDVRIDTPGGELAVSRLRVGDVVWSLDAAGARVAVPVRAVSRVPTGPSHPMIEVRLDDGRTLRLSEGHPFGDGAMPEALTMGDRLDGSVVTSAARVVYGGAATHDLLPDSASGAYWANGIVVRSTLRPRR